MKGIYQIRHELSGKRYIGSSKDVSHRWKQHVYALRNGKHHSALLQRAWDKYGELAFVFEALETMDSLLDREQYWMELYSAYVRTHGYDIRPFVNSVLSHSEETKAKIRAARAKQDVEPLLKGLRKHHERARGVPRTAEVRSKISKSHIGKVVSLETRQKRRINQTGKKASEETRKKMSAPQSASMPPERRAKISAVNKGRIHTDAVRAVFSAAQRVRWDAYTEAERKAKTAHLPKHPSAECIARSVVVNKGRKQSDEERAKWSAAIKAWWASRG